MGSAGEVHLITVKAFPLDPENSPPRLLAGFCLDHATCIISRQAENALAWEAKFNAALSELSQAVINAASPRGALPPGHGQGPGIDRQRMGLGGLHGLAVQGVDLSRPGGGILRGQVMRRLPPGRFRVVDPLGPVPGRTATPPDQRGTQTAPGQETPRSPHHRFLCVPAVFRDKLLGQIALATSDRDFEARDLEALQRLAALFAIALERQQAEEALRAKEERFRSLVEAMSDLVWETDPAGRLTFISSKVYDLFGLYPGGGPG